MELHVDLLSPENQRKSATIVNGINMGGRLSVRFPDGGRVIIKVGEDKVIFKMYQMHHSAWEMDKIKSLGKKTDGKGNMKVVFQDEVSGQAYNNVSQEVRAAFQEQREAGWLFEWPPFVEWEYGKLGEAKDMGYWNSDNMNDLIKEFIDLFEFLYPDHQMLLNMDWSSNHAAMAPDARTVGNMRVLWGGERKRVGDKESGTDTMPVFDDYILEEGDIGPNLPPQWRSKIQKGKTISFSFQCGQKPFYGLREGVTAADVKGKPIGKRELAWRLGWYVEGMTEKGKGHEQAIPTKWQAGDLVVRHELQNGANTHCFQLYKVVEVPVEHENSKSGSDIIKCQWFEMEDKK